MFGETQAPSAQMTVSLTQCGIFIAEAEPRNIMNARMATADAEMRRTRHRRGDERRSSHAKVDEV